LLTLFAPGVGTIVVMTLRLITLRTCSGRAEALAEAPKDAPDPPLSW
jgi:hypothetical protein